jgi:hypothetical protein
VTAHHRNDASFPGEPRDQLRDGVVMQGAQDAFLVGGRRIRARSMKPAKNLDIVAERKRAGVIDVENVVELSGLVQLGAHRVERQSCIHEYSRSGCYCSHGRIVDERKRFASRTLSLQ